MPTTIGLLNESSYQLGGVSFGYSDDLQKAQEPVLVSIDLSDVKFT